MMQFATDRQAVKEVREAVLDAEGNPTGETQVTATHEARTDLTALDSQDRILASVTILDSHLDQTADQVRRLQPMLSDALAPEIDERLEELVALVQEAAQG